MTVLLPIARFGRLESGWWIEGDGWTMQPRGNLPISQARHICQIAAGALRQIPYAPVARPPRQRGIWVAVSEIEAHRANGWEILDDGAEFGVRSDLVLMAPPAGEARA